MKRNGLPDDVLFENIAQSNVLSFDTLFDRYYKNLCYYSIKITCIKEVSEEVVQDVFIKVWQNRQSIHIEKSIKSYLYRAVYNQSINAVRNNKLNNLVEIDSTCMERKSDDNADNQILLNELETVIFDTINSFPEKQRTVFLLTRFEGLTYRQISLELCMSEKMVEKYVSKSLSALRNRLSEYKKPIPPYIILLF